MKKSIRRRRTRKQIRREMEKRTRTMIMIITKMIRTRGARKKTVRREKEIGDVGKHNKNRCRNKQ